MSDTSVSGNAEPPSANLFTLLWGKGNRKGDLGLAKRVVPFFMGRVLRARYGRIILIVLLTLLSVGAQLGFLATLPLALDALTSVEDQKQNISLPVELPFDLSDAGLVGIGGIIFGLLALSAVTEFFLQRNVARINILTFNSLMRSILRRLMAENGGLPQGVSNAKQAASLFTKGARYGSLIGYRATRVIRPLLAVPALLFFCLWQSPQLTGLAFLIYLLAAPFHIILVQRGMGSMRRLIASAIAHGSSKKRLIAGLSEFPTSNDIDYETLARTYIDESSHDYLEAYYDRRMLAAWSMLVNLVAIAFALLAVFALVAYNPTAIALDLGSVLVLLIALRFLVTSIGQVVTDLTMIASYTPMCETLYRVLTEPAGSAIPKLADSIAAGLPGEKLPHRVIFVERSLPMPQLVPLVCATEGMEWADAAIVAGVYAPRHEGILANLLDEAELLISEPDREDRLALDPASLHALEAALEKQRISGWNETLWDQLPAAVKAASTFNAAIARDCSHIILKGQVAAHLNRNGWQAAQDIMRKRAIKAAQVLDSVPTSLTVPEGVEAAIFVAGTVHALPRIDDYRAQAPRIAEIYAAKLASAEKAAGEDIPSLEDGLDDF